MRPEMDPPGTVVVRRRSCTVKSRASTGNRTEGEQMGLKKYKPTSPGRRFQTVSDFAEDHVGSSPRSRLLEPLAKKGGRNNKGRITTRHQGGGHKRRYRKIDFKRKKDGGPGQGRHDRVRPESLGPHRPAALRRR